MTIPSGPDAAANLVRLEANVAMQRGVGIETRVVGPGELQGIEPSARVDDIAAAAYEEKTGCVDAVAATQGMARAANAAGARIVEGVAATVIGVTGGRVTGVTTRYGAIPCGTVVFANGPWSPALLAPLGIALPISAVRVQVATFLRPLDFARPHAAYVDIAAGMFCRPLGPGRTMVGVSGGDQHDPVDPDAFESTLDPHYPSRAQAALTRRFPRMAGAPFLAGHAGLYDMTPDAHPVIGGLGGAGVDGLYVAAGFSGAGFKKGPAVGHAMAELVVRGESTMVDLAPFRFERFSSDDSTLPWSETEYTLSSDFGHRF